MSSNESEQTRTGNTNPPGEVSDQDKPLAKTSDVPEQNAAQPPKDEPTEREVGKFERTRVSGWWAGLIIAAIVLIFLLVFILQNLESVQIHFLMFSGGVPIGVAMLLSAIAGLLIVAVPGTARMMQLRRHYKR